MDRLHIDVSKAWTGVVVRLIGPAGVATVDALDARLREVAAERPGLIVIDLGRATTLGSLAMGSLVMLQKKMRFYGGAVRLAGARGGVLSAIRTVHLDAVFEMYANADEALNGRGGRRLAAARA